jgi:hypothetical protein
MATKRENEIEGVAHVFGISEAKAEELIANGLATPFGYEDD